MSRWQAPARYTRRTHPYRNACRHLRYQSRLAAQAVNACVGVIDYTLESIQCPQVEATCYSAQYCAARAVEGVRQQWPSLGERHTP